MNFCIRVLDFILSLLGLVLLSPLLICIIVLIKFDSKGPVFFRQNRVGKNGKQFYLWKFRTMSINSDRDRLLTIGMDDSRITKTGLWLRKYKIDEIPQLINVLKNDMSIVGPRPEVPKYVDLYSDAQRKVLLVKPGITDYASIEYAYENDLLKNSSDPEKTYIEVIMPSKIKLNMKYIEEPFFRRYIYIIFLTIKRIVQNR